jgi:hypothetical protein
MFAAIVTFVFFAGLALWVPFLSFCERLLRQEDSAETAELPELDVSSLALD